MTRRLPPPVTTMNNFKKANDAETWTKNVLGQGNRPCLYPENVRSVTSLGSERWMFGSNWDVAKTDLGKSGVGCSLAHSPSPKSKGSAGPSAF